MKSPKEALQPEAAPPPPPSTPRRRRLSLTSIVSGTLSFVIVAAIVGLIGWSYAVHRVTAAGPLTADKTVILPPGGDVPETLEEQGVIENAQVMTAALLIEGNRAKVKAGEYLFKQNASLQDVIDTLVSGKQVLHALTIPEGLTSQQVVERLKDNDVLVGDIKAVPPEGSLMPDTFKFARGTTREQIVRTMQQEAKKVVADVWAHRDTDTPIRSPYEMVTLASIVEKETGKPDERPRVAGVFMNRLSKNIPLQSDPTIVYGLVGGRGTLGRGILKSEVEQKTPYNTYAISGLPPGPIANPGKAALEAVASPSRTKDLYFVADGTGGHAFAETLDQHRANVARWRQIEKDAKDKLTPDADKGATAPPPGTPALPGRGNQRGDLNADPEVFGALNGFAPGPAPVNGRTAAAAVSGPDRMAAYPLSFAATGFASNKAGQSAASHAFDELNVQVDGLESPEQPASDDFFGTRGEQATADRQGSMQTFPLSAARQAELKSRAAAYGLPDASSGPAPREDASAGPPARLQQAAALENGAPVPGGSSQKGKIFDASEGTSFDPLRDKSYDLTTAKSVPVIKGLPPLPKLATP